MTTSYRSYGLTISSEVVLPELIPLQMGVVEDADVRIAFGKVDEASLARMSQFGRNLWAGESVLCLQVPQVARFLMREGKEILIEPDAAADEDEIRLYLLGSAFGVILYQRGFLVLHGNAIRVGDSCMVCLGHSGAGKSTLAAAFMRRGHQILSDDVTPIDVECQALPGFPRIKLWQDAAERMNINVSGLRRIRAGEEKFHLPATESYAVRPLPIKWIYVLERGSLQDVQLEAMHGLERFRLLHQNTYRAGYLKALKFKGEHLKLCRMLSDRVRLARLVRPDSGDTVEELVERILADVAEYP
ncbi:MAG TPA: hypothetical protein VFF26_12495 [Gallionella sp.]|nr:hypothetical protein [Gallionella sp.]